VLAGGSGTRLLPLSKVTNKHLLPVGQKPMIYYPIEKLVAAGITDILIVTGTNHMGDIVRCLGSGTDFGCTFTYKVQDAAGGIAQALGLAKGFAYGERVCVILGDNMFEDDLTEIVQEYNVQERGARVVLKMVPNLARYGIAMVNSEDTITQIVEKPSKDELAKLSELKDNKGAFAVTGIYFYDQRVYTIIDKLAPSRRGELEITDVNNAYLEWGELKHSCLNGWWTDAGTHESLYMANTLISDMDR